MLVTTHLPITDVLTTLVQADGRAGVPFLNWRIVARKAADLAHYHDAFLGAGIYALCFNGASIYIGSYLGEGKGGAYLNGNLVTSRLWTHMGAITMRGHRVHLARRSLTSLVKQFSPDHPLVRELAQCTDAELLFTDNGNLAPLRRIRFAAEHWDSFANDDADAVMSRFSFCYVRLKDYPAHLTALDLKQELIATEKHLIRRFAPACNTTHVPAGKAPVRTSGAEVLIEIQTALNHLVKR